MAGLSRTGHWRRSVGDLSREHDAEKPASERNGGKKGGDEGLDVSRELTRRSSGWGGRRQGRTLAAAEPPAVPGRAPARAACPSRCGFPEASSVVSLDCILHLTGRSAMTDAQPSHSCRFSQ